MLLLRRARAKLAASGAAEPWEAAAATEVGLLLAKRLLYAATEEACAPGSRCASNCFRHKTADSLR